MSNMSNNLSTNSNSRHLRGRDSFVKISDAVCAKSSHIKSSVKKLKLVADLIRGASTKEALLQLTFCNKKVAKDFCQVLKSAIANAENNCGYDIDKLYVSRIDLGKSMSLRRMRAGARGRGRSIIKHYSKIAVFVAES